MTKLQGNDQNYWTIPRTGKENHRTNVVHIHEKQILYIDVRRYCVVSRGSH